MNYNVNEGPQSSLPSPALYVPLDVNVDGHSEQFKHSCIVQPEHCGFCCNKSKVTALGSGTRDCHCLNKLYETLRRYLSGAKRCCKTHSQKFPLLKMYFYKARGFFLTYCSLHQTTSPNLLFDKDMSLRYAPGASCGRMSKVCGYTRARTVLPN